MIRRAISVCVGVVILLSGEFWTSYFLSWPGRSRMATSGTLSNVAIIGCFAVAGCLAGAIASRRDAVPLIGIEIFGVGSVLLSLAIAAVESGTKEVTRNAEIGVAGLLVMAIVYVALQRLRPIRS